MSKLLNEYDYAAVHAQAQELMKKRKHLQTECCREVYEITLMISVQNLKSKQKRLRSADSGRNST